MNTPQAISKSKHIEENGVWGPDELEDKVVRPTQWGLVRPDTFKAFSLTRKKLAPGAYTITRDNQDDQPIYFRRQIKSDTDMKVSEGLSKQIIEEITNFWVKNETFRKNGFLHSRGYLLYGSQGVGKSSVVRQIMSNVIENDGIVFICGNPAFFNLGLKVFRQTEPDRPVVCVFEDIDAIIRKYGEDEILSILDGENQIDRVLNIATTNYPENLDRRIISRPRRFDRVYKIEPPSETSRREYFCVKLPKMPKAKLETWVKKTKGLTFAGLAELLISTQCLGNKFDETIKVLKDLENGHPSSADFGGRIGFEKEGKDNDEEGSKVECIED